MKTPAISPLPVIVFLLLCAFSSAWLQTPLTKAQSNTISMQVDRPGAAIAPTMFGLFFEDINFGEEAFAGRTIGCCFVRRNHLYAFPNSLTVCECWLNDLGTQCSTRA